MKTVLCLDFVFSVVCFSFLIIIFYKMKFLLLKKNIDWGLTVFIFALHFQKKEYNKYIQKKICITHKNCVVKNKK